MYHYLQNELKFKKNAGHIETNFIKFRTRIGTNYTVSIHKCSSHSVTQTSDPS